MKPSASTLSHSKTFRAILYSAALALSLGVAWPVWAAAPFTVNGDYTVTDSSTSLVWDQCPYGLSDSACATGTAFHGAWASALTKATEANAASYKGFSDWRVPNVAELESIAKIDSFTLGVPAIDTTAFPGTPGDRFWTSTTYAPSPSNAWIVYFNDGSSDARSKANSYYVRLVRSGQSLASFDSLRAGLLNDTGQTQCNNGSAMGACNDATTGDTSARPRQDGRFGRDVASPSKTVGGGGDAGFDFTKVCMDGTLNCAGAADTNASPASAAAWACTKDNVTNLIWSLYSGQGEWTTYARTTLPNADNTQSRCGFNTGWRLPTRRELLSIVHYGGQSPSIDSSYFPATQANWYWTNDPYQPYPADAWVVYFILGDSFADDTTNGNYVRLVRSGQ